MKTYTMKFVNKTKNKLMIKFIQMKEELLWK